MTARSIFVFIACLTILPGVPAGAQDAPLVVLSRAGIWEGVSQMIGFMGRLWFVNSVKFRNHNSADLYSYDPVSGDTRYERHLFSQDAGDPVVSGGLLYWPFEDARFSSGRGEYAVTNGQLWRWRVLPEGEVFHVHAMAAHGTTLFAATSAWRGGLQRSDDGGASWKIVYDHPTPAGRVSRFTSLALLGDTLYAGLTSHTDQGGKLFRLEKGTLVAVSDWPRGQRSTVLQAHAGWLYAVNDDGAGSAVWRTDGTRVEAVTGLDGMNVRAFASGAQNLWAVSAGAGNGTLWRSRDGLQWMLVQRFERAEPLGVAVYAGDVYVGTRGPGERGALWGPPAPANAESTTMVPMPRLSPATGSDPIEQLRQMNDGLSNVRDFNDYRVLLNAYLQPMALGRSPLLAEQLTQLLRADVSPLPLRAFGGALETPLDQINRWFVLWAMGLSGSGSVPPAYLTEDWRAPRNRAEKYFELAPAAAWAAGQTGQREDAIIAALIARLDTDDEPRWLRGDWVGALSALSGERFGYDSQAWREWWSTYRGMVKVPPGGFSMGSDSGEPAERPVHEVTVSGFYLDRFEVTNATFSEFVTATNHVTDPERAGVGWHWTGEWQQLKGADWRHPRGPQSSIDGLGQHPVVQVSWRDAAAYCEWRRKRLPSEAEWERAARDAGGVPYAWGNARPGENGFYRASYGSDQCCRADDGDGYLYTAPVGSFPSGRSPFGVDDMTGNVWEWVSDTYDATFYGRSPPTDPINTAPGNRKVIRGGGWGNNPWGLRATLRHANTPESGLSMVGFRCAESPPSQS
jgi:formylglycine-generating enzyme required for sulfatase activity